MDNTVSRLTTLSSFLVWLSSDKRNISSRGSRTLRPQDTWAPRHIGTTKLVPKFKTNHRWSYVSHRNCPRSKRPGFSSITALVSKCLVPRFWCRSVLRPVPKCLRVSCCRSVLWPKCPVTPHATLAVSSICGYDPVQQTVEERAAGLRPTDSTNIQSKKKNAVLAVSSSVTSRSMTSTLTSLMTLRRRHSARAAAYDAYAVASYVAVLADQSYAP